MQFCNDVELFSKFLLLSRRSKLLPYLGSEFCTPAASSALPPYVRDMPCAWKTSPGAIFVNKISLSVMWLLYCVILLCIK